MKKELSPDFVEIFYKIESMLKMDSIGKMADFSEELLSDITFLLQEERINAWEAKWLTRVTVNQANDLLLNFEKYQSGDLPF